MGHSVSRNTVKFRGGPAAVIGDVDSHGESQSLAGITSLGRRGSRTIREPEDLLNVCHERRNPMEKGFGAVVCPPIVSPVASENAVNQIIENTTPATTVVETLVPRPDVIAIRKTCDAEGTGLSHYVLMDKQVSR